MAHRLALIPACLSSHLFFYHKIHSLIFICFFPVYRHKHRQIYTDTHTHTHTFAVDNFFCSFKYNCNHRWIHFFIIHFLLWGIVTLLCSVSFSSLAKWISYTHIHILLPLGLPLPDPHPIHPGHPRAPSWARCATQRALTSHLFYTWQACMWIPLSQFIPPNCCVHASIFIQHSFSLFTFILLTTISSTHNCFRQHSALEVEWWTRQTGPLISKSGTYVGRDNK